MKDAYLGAPVVKMTSNGVAQRLKEKGKVRLKELAEEHRDFRSTTGPARGGAWTDGEAREGFPLPSETTSRAEEGEGEQVPDRQTDRPSHQYFESIF